ncbi:Zn-dependent oligopeptidase [Arsenicicoccus piscis]|uniref:M3 family metallopeptidase n=1 Tax=Arsenicicoccus piscis TaxID=673954 RepID=UPI001F4D31AC|nr:M3 family metallopeptidase [Arsenicicoccus piscis]MCH8626847.1 Zn-dependent oligopeptidase [Arsenicicoccus piscis]
MTNPLAPLELPPTPQDWTDWLRTRVDHDLAEAARLRDRLRTLGRNAPGGDGSSGTPEQHRNQVLGTWNELYRTLRGISALTNLVVNVHPEAATREVGEEAERRISELYTALGQDELLYRALRQVPTDDVDETTRRMVELELRDFKRAGVDADRATRERLVQLSKELTELGQEFDRRIRDDVRSITIDASRLGGLPQDWIDAHQPDENGQVTITTDYPDLLPFTTFAQDREARLALSTVSLQRGWPDNQATLAAMIERRNERARLLGYPDWADYDAEVKMIGEGEAIAAFIDDVVAKARPAAEADRELLLRRLREDHPDVDTVYNTDASYYTELIRREQHGVDSQHVRSYFSFPQVRDGLLDVTGKLFGMTWTPRPDAPLWHEDVTAYDVDVDGETIGRMYLDLHPRDNKFKHAAQFDLVAGIEGRQLAEGVLVCNLPTGLMEHNQVVTLFHEFGHLVHHLLAGRQRWVRDAGITTEWDFVEAPSQMLEEWAWDAAVLRTFARNAEGEPIPTELVTKMRAASDVAKAWRATVQMFYASLSYYFHHAPQPDLDAQHRELMARYNIADLLPDTHMHTSFGHLHGYSSAYYTYMWSLVIAKDLYSAFDHDDPFDLETARRYRDKVLAPGGSRDAAELVEDFLGRPYTTDAFTAWLAE